MSDLPSTWLACSLGEVVDYAAHKTASPDQFDENDWLLELEDIEKDSSKVIQRLTVADRQPKSNKNKFLAGDVLYGKLRPYLNKVVIADKDGICTSEIIPISVNQLDNRFVFHSLKSKAFLNYVSSVAHGMRMPRLGTKQAKAAPFALPPLNEQTRIANKLDELLAQVDTIKARVDAMPAILKRFRQSVLAAAVSGKLTEEWRKANNEKVDWVEVPFSDLLAQLRSGSADKPNNDINGIPILRSSAVRPMAIDYSDIKYLDKTIKLNEHNSLKKGDLIFTRLSGSAEYVGNCALVGELAQRFQYPDRLFCARLIDQRHAKYLEYFFASNIFRLHISGALKSSAGHQRITLDVIKKALVKLPPIEEQKQIVQRIEQLFAFADQIEQRVNEAQSRIDNLSQSILAKAFRGELVPQDPNDEPASVLLERIKQEREEAAKLAKATKKIKKKK